MFRSGFATARQYHSLRQIVRASYTTSFVVLCLLITAALGQRLASTIGEPESKALISISRVLAKAPASTSTSLLRDVGYTPSNVPPGWSSFPMVRKIESVYLSAEQASPKQGSYVLALLARSLAQQYDGVKYDPALKDVLNAPPATGPITFASLNQYEKPDPAVQRAILAISRYVERGQLGGSAAILQYHFNLPPESAYDILRTSASNDEAIARGLARVPADRRHACLERLVAHLDSSFPDTAPMERDLESFRPRKKTATPGPIITDEHTSRPDKPGRSGGGGGGGGGSESPSNTAGSNPVEPLGGPGSEVGAEPPLTSDFMRRQPQETYETRVPEWYGSAPVAFEEMVVVEGGAGGVVFGNSFRCLIKKQAEHLEYLPFSDSVGQLIVEFADKSQATYGPVESGDVYAAYNIVFGDGKRMPEFHEGQGMPLLGIEDQRAHYDITDDSIRLTGGRFAVVAHPALSHVSIGRSFLMSDVLPVGRKNLERLVRQVDESKVGVIYDAMPTNVIDWKITDASITLQIEENQIIAKNSNPSNAPDTFLTAREYREGESKFDKNLVPHFERFVPLLIEASPDYKRLNDFVPVFDLIRWAHSQHIPFINAGSLVPGAAQTISKWVVSEDSGVRLIFNEESVSPLQNLTSKYERRLEELRRSVPAEWQATLVNIESPWFTYASTEQQIDVQVERYAERSNQFYRLDQQLSSAVDSTSDSKQFEYLLAGAHVRDVLGGASASDKTANDLVEIKREYEKGEAQLIEIEEILVPAAKEQILASHAAKSDFDWQIASLERTAIANLKVVPKMPEIYTQLVPLLPEDTKQIYKEMQEKIKAASDEKTSAEEVQMKESLAEVDERIAKHFFKASPAVRRKFESFDEADWDTPEFDAFLSRLAPSLRSAREQVSVRLDEIELQRIRAESDIAEAEQAIQKSIEGFFPDFQVWSKLLVSYENVKL